jgi:AcrR family transcriptional regulator
MLVTSLDDPVRVATDRAFDADIGARVRGARTRRGLSLRAVARSLDLSPAALSQVETGKTRLTVTRLSRIAEVLGKTVDEVLATPAGEAESPLAALDRLADEPVGHSPALVSTISDWREYGPSNFDPVLQAALRVFVTTGYHGATVRDVARECGMSVSGIYHYYPSKHDMLYKILDLGVSELLHRSELARAEGRDAVQRFSLMVESLVLFHTYRSEVGFVGASEMRSLNEPGARQDIAHRRMQQQRMIDTEVMIAVDQGCFHTPHPLDASRSMVAMCTAVAQWFNINGPETPAGLAAKHVVFGLDLMRYRVR